MTAPTPTSLKVLRGTYRRDRANPAEPHPEVGARPPAWLPRSGPARAAWRRLAPRLAEMRVLTVADADALALACMALAEYLEARADANGWRRADAAWKRYASALGWFGMNPSARTRVAAVPDIERDPIAEWMARPTSQTPPAPRPARKRAEPAPTEDPFDAWARGAHGDPNA